MFRKSPRVNTGDVMAGYTSATPDLSRVERALLIVNELRSSLVDLVQRSSIDQLHLSGKCRVADLSPDDLHTLRDDGHATRIELREGTWNATVVFDGPSDPTLDTSGRTEDAFSATEVAEIERAVSRRDGFLLLTISAQLEAQVHIDVRNQPAQSGTHWVSSLSELEAQLCGPMWTAAVLALGDGPRLLTVSEPKSLGTFPVGRLLLRGSDDSYDSADVPEQFEPDRGFRSVRSMDTRPNLPSPLLFASSAIGKDQPEAVASVVGIATGIARCLVWHWLATSSGITAGTMSVTISGARIVSFDLAPEACADATPEISLYLWAATSEDPARLDAVEQAASLAITNGSDIASASAPALRTARSLYEIARRGAISEALASRRSAREAALDAARGAADSAREAAGKSIERTLVQVAAVVGVAITEFGNVISRAQAIVLLGVVALLSVVFLLVTCCFSLRSASDGLSAELADLDQYREALAAEDIGLIRRAETIASAQHDLRRAYGVVASIYLASIAAAGVAMGLIAGHSQHTK